MLGGIYPGQAYPGGFPGIAEAVVYPADVPADAGETLAAVLTASRNSVSLTASDTAASLTSSRLTPTLTSSRLYAVLEESEAD